MATLDDLKDIFSSVNDSIISLGSSLNNQMTSLNTTNDELLKATRSQKEVLDKILGIEQKRDKVKPDTTFAPPSTGGDTTTQVKSAARVAGEEVGSLLTSFDGLLAGAVALGLAFAGLRGWEVKIIDYVKDGFGSIKNSIVGGLKSIKTNIFLAFGLDDAGKVITNSALDDLLKTPIMKNITAGISKILAPLKMMGDFLGGLFSGSGGDDATKGAIKFLGEMGGGVAAFAKTVGKILKPIGFLFSAYDAVMAFMNTEGDLYDKFIAGIGGFIGDFVGAPLDLLKSIVSWATSKLGFEGVTEFLDSFSFETVINDIIGGVFGMVKDAAKWVGTLFTDPGAALTDLWNLYYGEGGLVDMMFTPISMAIDWITKKFGWRDEDAPPFDLYATITGFVDSVMTWAGEKLTTISNTLSDGFNSFVDYIVTIPDRIKFAAEGMFIEVASRLEKGFITFGDWIASIPARIKLLALSAINSALSGLPEWAQIVSSDDVKAAQDAVNARSGNTEAKLEDLDKRTAEKRLDLESRMSASGIYETAAAATAEAKLTGNNNEEKIIAEQFAYADKKLADSVRANEIKMKAIEEYESRRSGVVGSINAPTYSPTDARTATYVGGPTIINNMSYDSPELSFGSAM
jgi:hypothetical protein